jgi:transposase
VFQGFIEGTDRGQVSLLPACVDDYVAPDALARVVDAFLASLNLTELGFSRTVAAVTGRPRFHPGDMLRLYIWGYLNQVRSPRHLERACVRDLANTFGADKLVRAGGLPQRRAWAGPITSELSTATSFITACPPPRPEGRHVARCIHARG